MPDSSPAAPTPTQVVKPRNPIEKAIVRGFIAVMLVVVAVEAYSWWQCKRTMGPLMDQISAVENGADLPALTEADIKAAVGNKVPVHTETLNAVTNGYGASRVDVYSWFTFSPVKKRDVYVYYSRPTPSDNNGPEVLAIQTDDSTPATDAPRPMTAKEREEWRKAEEIMAGNPGGPPGIIGQPGSRPANDGASDSGKP